MFGDCQVSRFGSNVEPEMVNINILLESTFGKLPDSQLASISYSEVRELNVLT